MKYDGKVWTGLIWFRVGTGADTYACGNGQLGSIKCEKVPD